MSSGALSVKNLAFGGCLRWNYSTYVSVFTSGKWWIVLSASLIYPPSRCKKCNHSLEGPKFETGKCPACGHIDQEIVDFFDKDAARRYEQLHPEDVRAARNAIRMAAAMMKQKSPELN